MIKQFKPHKFAEGEFISRTQMPIGKVDTAALRRRAIGISHLRAEIESRVGSEFIRQLIAAMNYSVAEANKELKKRGLALKPLLD